MKYYKTFDQNGNLAFIHKTAIDMQNAVEITEEEYNEILSSVAPEQTDDEEGILSGLGL